LAVGGRSEFEEKKYWRQCNVFLPRQKVVQRRKKGKRYSRMNEKKGKTQKGQVQKKRCLTCAFKESIKKKGGKDRRWEGNPGT